MMESIFPCVRWAHVCDAPLSPPRTECVALVCNFNHIIAVVGIVMGGGSAFHAILFHFHCIEWRKTVEHALTICLIRTTETKREKNFATWVFVFDVISISSVTFFSVFCCLVLVIVITTIAIIIFIIIIHLSGGFLSNRSKKVQKENILLV